VTNRRRCLVVLGDSVAEGWGDPDPAGGWIGWPVRLADRLRMPRRHIVNVAKPGATTADVTQDQLPAVMDLRPDMVVINCGMNDALNGFDRAEVGDRLDEIFAWARSIGGVAVAAPVPHPPFLERSPMSKLRRGRTLQRIHDFNEELSRSSRASGMPDLPQDSVDAVGDPQLWDDDGIHLNSTGHAYVAEVIANILEQPAQ